MQLAKPDRAAKLFFASQYLCVAVFLSTCAFAVAWPAVLQGIYESTLAFLGIEQRWTAMFEVASTRFPQAAAHSVLAGFSLATAYVIGLVRAANYLSLPMTWDANDKSVRDLSAQLQSNLLEKALILPLASYIGANNTHLFASHIADSPNPEKGTVAAGWLRYIVSKAALSIVAVEVALVIALLVFGQPDLRESVGAVRYFTVNSLLLFFLLGVAFKASLTTFAIVRVCLKGRN